ncbi:MAG: alpha/beta hydrolase [Anaerolineae bacterium]
MAFSVAVHQTLLSGQFGLNSWPIREFPPLRIHYQIILVGHSVGGSILLKYLSEENVKKPIVGIFLIATPYFGAEDWQVDEVTLHEGFGSQLPQGAPIFLYHSRDDEWVPFAHLAMYAKQLPQATIREFDDRGHQFNNDLSEVASDIANLQKEEL